MVFIENGIARSVGSLAVGRPSLDYEIVNQAVECETVVKRSVDAHRTVGHVDPGPPA